MKQAMALGDTRNQTWANDKSKFGYKMLQKMGWMEGKGLGVKEDGTTEHIRIKRKTTNVGVGGEAALDDWTKPAHVAAGLNDVLARLAPVNCSVDAVKTEKVTKKGRGYFQRRSAGKNVSGYSEMALKEIFGGIDVDSKSSIATGDAKTDTARCDGQEVKGRWRENLIGHVERKVEKKDAIEQDTESSPELQDRKKRKALDKEERKKAKAKAKAKRKSLAVEATIKKVKKSKKNKKRER